MSFDVAVVGGGIAGLSAALMLKRDGARVAVLEMRRLGRGVTGCTTAKVSALQGTVYSTIRGRHGPDAARTYAEASQAGVDDVAALVAEEKIECSLQRRPAFTYAAQESERSSIEQEADASGAAGLATQLVDEPDLPYATHGAIRLEEQLQLHPVLYAQGLARAIDGDGSAVLEGSRVERVEVGKPCIVHAADGLVRADHVVVASHYPFLDRGLYFARLKPQRSYCVAARIRGAPPRGMSISAGSPSRSIREHEGLLIIGGEGHSAGSREATPERFERLTEFGRKHWDVEEFTHRWSAHDPVPYDHLPVIGPYYPGSSRLWVTGGFMKWGFTSATFGARILSDAIAGRENRWASTFSPSRISLRSLPEAAQLGGKFALDFVGDRLRPPQRSKPGTLEPGEAMVAADGLGKKGVYRDDNGTLHAVSLRCTHLGCLLRFNSAERSWDCPCHGSRFGVDGGVLEGPAVDPLERRDP